MTVHWVPRITNSLWEAIDKCAKDVKLIFKEDEKCMRTALYSRDYCKTEEFETLLKLAGLFMNMFRFQE